MRALDFIPERVNPEVIDPGYSVRRQLPNGMIIQAEAMTPYSDDPDPYMQALRGVTIRVFDPASDNWMHKKFGVGEVRFLAQRDPDTQEWNLRPSGVMVNPAYQRQGIASAMYNFARHMGNDIVPGLAQSAQGQAFWQKGSAGQGRDFEFQEVPPEPETSPEQTSKVEPPRGLADRLRSMLSRQKEPA
jgi:GNAT superfamily N-acetyltransferase